MGIPAFFSHVVRMFPYVMIEGISRRTSSFYIDSNSIIYDGVRELETEKNVDDKDTFIIEYVISKIEEYKKIVNPSKLCYIAFDGVAPRAKLEQQRERRFKTHMNGDSCSTVWDTTQITPGTFFMERLGLTLSDHFTGSETIVSGSEEPGEGEHKIFQYIRDHVEQDNEGDHVVYGLDADLIMLCLNHLPQRANLFIFRETPVYMMPELDPDKMYMMDIAVLYQSIQEIMGSRAGVHDYVLMGFLLGNDFLPKFPTLDIRTDGIEKLFAGYKEASGGTEDFHLVRPDLTIHWEHLMKMLVLLAGREEAYMQIAHDHREKRARVIQHYREDTKEQRETKRNLTPSYQRGAEIRIDPRKTGWQRRYYETLFPGSIETLLPDLCSNYVNGLVWNLRYYCQGCSDWNYTYHYNYPPLISDIVAHLYSTSFPTSEISSGPISPIEQLVYVLPRKSLHHIPDKAVYESIIRHPEFELRYPLTASLQWAYCKYLWEAHVILPDFTIRK